MIEELQKALVDWFRRGHRDMPWRRTRDPYAIWVSEIMLQQTQVETVRPYFTRWMERFPTVQALAAAPEDEVLAAWAGLGYYARARNLHAAAREVVAGYGGQFPSAPEQIRALPGIGPYTAGAIASIAFGRPEPILDGNVARVLQRIYRLPGAPDDAALRKALWARAAELVPRDAPGDFNQALMELGATVCTPRSPACLACPVMRLCRARAQGEEGSIPSPKKKAATRVVELVTVLIERRGGLLLVRRPSRGLWGGLWEPPTGERRRGEEARAAASRIASTSAGLSLTGVESLEPFEHQLTHRRMRFSPFRARARGTVKLAGYEDERWLAPAEARDLGVAAWAARLITVLEGAS